MTITVTSNKTTLSLTDFQTYCNENGYTVTDAQISTFRSTQMVESNLFDPASLEVWKHYFFHHFLGLFQNYFYHNNEFVDFGPLPQLEALPIGTALDVNGHPINTQDDDSASVSTPVQIVSWVEPTQNSDIMFLSDFEAYSNRHGFQITDAQVASFKSTQMVASQLTDPQPLETWKHYFFLHFLNRSTNYFYVNNVFVDYGPLPQLEAWPSDVALDGSGHPINPFPNEDSGPATSTPSTPVVTSPVTSTPVSSTPFTYNTLNPVVDTMISDNENFTLTTSSGLVLVRNDTGYSFIIGNKVYTFDFSGNRTN